VEKSAHGICRDRGRHADDGTDRHQRILRQTLEIENCLHTYFHVGDIRRGFSSPACRARRSDDFAAGGNGARKVENDSVLRITKETNRVYPDTRHRGNPRRKSQAHHSRGKIQFPIHRRLESVDDAEIAGRFRPGGTQNMVCVESGNVKQNKISLAPGKTTALKVVLSSAPLK
jgi:D-hexose-6-phosphate mutarotase